MSINLGGVTGELYDEFCRWLESPEIVANLDVVFVHETWRLSSDYKLPHWSWVSSGSKPVSGQGVATLINTSYALPAVIRTREVRVGRILQVLVPAKGDKQGRFLNLVNVYQHAKVSESPQTYAKRDGIWKALEGLLATVPNRHYLCMAGDFNTDLLPAPGVATGFTSPHGERTLARIASRTLSPIKGSRPSTPGTERPRSVTLDDMNREWILFLCVAGRFGDNFARSLSCTLPRGGTGHATLPLPGGSDFFTGTGCQWRLRRPKQLTRRPSVGQAVLGRSRTACTVYSQKSKPSLRTD